MEVGAWLSQLGLGQYGDVFAENDIDAATLRELSVDDLKELGVVSLGHRKKLLAAIAELDSDAPDAGPPLADTAASAGEHRQVTVLFADIAGFTKLSRDLGAEEAHALLNRYFEVVDGIVENFGGTIDKHMGDSVMAVFGAPIAHDDDPYRAVRAALDIHQAMTGLADDVGHPLRAHIGIASGQVVASGTGSDAHREYTVTGDSVNLAARLGDLAKPGETLVSDAVRHVVSDHIECESLGEVAIRGLDQSVEVWRVGSLRAADVARGAFVGRRSELRQFSGMVEACRETANGQAVLVRGEAGIGKTRLVEEFAAIADDLGFTRHKGLVLDFGVGAGQDAIRAIVRSLLAIAPGSDAAARQGAAEAVIADGLLAVDQRVFLNDLLDLPQPVEERAMYDAMDGARRNSGRRELVARLIEQVSAESPILLIAEDIHLADAVVLDHLAGMTSTVPDCSALLLMTSRIEGDPLDKGWRAATGNSPLMTIDLGPLRKDEAIALAGAFIDATKQFAMDCIARAEGNPLFLEHLVRSAKESGVAKIPDSIQSLVLSRMDRLPAVDKRALQAASVVGQRFALDALRHLIGDADYVCTVLIEHYLVRPEGDGYLFANALIREGVYSSLLKARMRELHGRAAEWFADRDPSLHAEHLERAEHPGAARAYLEATRVQVEQFRFEQALQLVERGLAVTQEASDTYRLSMLKGECLRDIGRAADSISVYRQALEVAADDAEKCRAWIGLASGMRVTDDYDESLAVLARAERAARDHTLLKELSQVHYYRGSLYFPLGNIEGCLTEHRTALDYAQQADSPDCEVRALSGLGDAYYSQGRMITSLDYFRRCIDLCRAHGYGRIEVGSRYMVSWNRLYLNQVSDALDDALESIEAAKKVGHGRAEMVARLAAGRVLLETGDIAAAETHVERGLELAELLGANRFNPFFMIFLSRIRLAQNRDRPAIVNQIRDAIDIARGTGFGFLGPWLLSTLALVGDDASASDAALAEGEDVLSGGCVGHNYFDFYRDAMAVALRVGDWDRVDRYADALAAYTESEPLPWSDFFIAQGRALAAHGRNPRDDANIEKLRSLRDEADSAGLRSALPALDAALAAT